MTDKLFKLAGNDNSIEFGIKTDKPSKESIRFENRDNVKSQTCQVKAKMMEELKILGLTHEAIERILNIKKGRI